MWQIQGKLARYILAGWNLSERGLFTHTTNEARMTDTDSEVGLSPRSKWSKQAEQAMSTTRPSPTKGRSRPCLGVLELQGAFPKTQPWIISLASALLKRASGSRTGQRSLQKHGIFPLSGQMGAPRDSREHFSMFPLLGLSPTHTFARQAVIA